MHSSTLYQWQHSHSYNIDSHKGEVRTRLVILITVLMMAVEITTGYLFGSMALLADGYHMGTHAAALSITVFAYIYARKHANNPRYSFSTGKVGVLGGFASAVVLGIIALYMGGESLRRLFAPVEIQFNEAIGVAVIGLVVNLVCAYLLHAHHSHDENHHGHGHHDHDHHHHHDHDGERAALSFEEKMGKLLIFFGYICITNRETFRLDPDGPAYGNSRCCCYYPLVSRLTERYKQNTFG